MQAFFHDHFLAACSAEERELVVRLKECIAAQVPLLEWGVCVHAWRAGEAEQPFHDMLLRAFHKTKLHVEQKYGKKVLEAL